MDPKSSNSLDPKLKEVYDRVMNTKITPTTAQAQPVVAQGQDTTQPPLPQVPAQPAQNHSTPIPPPPLASTGNAPKSAVDYNSLATHYTAPATPQPVKPAVVTPSGTTYGVVNNATPKDESSEKKGSSKTLLIAGGLFIFFILYTVVWVFVLGLELPFSL